MSQALDASSTRARLVVRAQRLVVKVGTNVLSTPARQLDTARVATLCEQIHRLRQQGRQVVLVSSGAIGAGMAQLGWTKRPKELVRLQAAAAVGQSRLMVAYDECFRRHGSCAGQVLLTREDFDDRHRYLNVRNTLEELLRLGAIPVINENDTVSVAELELRFSDNDVLSALVSHLLHADLLVILSSVEGLYRADEQGQRRRLSVVAAIDESILRMDDGTRSSRGTGGMGTKLEAAVMGTRAGHAVIIADGRVGDILDRIIAGSDVGTLFLPAPKQLASRKRWIGYGVAPKGKLLVDAGARRALVEGGKSLLASGLREVRGRFSEGDIVDVIDETGQAFARGVTNYSSPDLRKLCGRKTGEIVSLLGRETPDEVVHRNNLVVLSPRRHEAPRQG